MIWWLSGCLTKLGTCRLAEEKEILKQYTVISVGLRVAYRWVVFCFVCFLITVCVLVADCNILHVVMLSADMHKSHTEMRKVLQYVCGTSVVLLNDVMKADSHLLKCFSHR